jgi:hypothetical protein
MTELAFHSTRQHILSPISPICGHLNLPTDRQPLD